MLETIPELEEHKKGRHSLLAFRDHVGFTLSVSCAYFDAIILSKAAKIRRRDMLDHNILHDGSCNVNSKPFPPSLLEFVGLIEHGTDIKS